MRLPEGSTGAAAKRARMSFDRDTAGVGGMSARALPRWGCGASDAPPATEYPRTMYVPAHDASPFACDPYINDRIALWHGDISSLKADAIVNTTSESLDERNPISDKIFARAGSSLKEEIHNDDKDCRTGDVCVTSAHNLHARYIIHTVGPKYNPKYQMASENSLHMCYRNVLFKAQELGAQTLALCVINTAKRNFPPDVGAHIALRTIRRFLEEYSIPKLVVLCAGEPAEAALFEALAPLYFPRVEGEVEGARWRLPSDVGGRLGAPDQPPERRIRIIDNPHYARNKNADDDVTLDLGYSDGEDWSGDERRPRALAAAAAAALGGTTAVGDTQRLLGPDSARFPPIADLMATQIEHHERYDRLLRRARTEDLSEVSGIGCLYQSGIDRLGRPVVVFVGKWLPVANINLDKALLYLILLLDPIVRGDYVIAYFHTLASTNNYPPFSWLKEVYGLLPYKYKKNLKAFYIVHPTFWTKMMTWWFTTFMAPAIKQKVHNLPGIEYLYSAMSRDQLEIPAFITEYDMTINGLHYFQPDGSST